MESIKNSVEIKIKEICMVSKSQEATNAVSQKDYNPNDAS